MTIDAGKDNNDPVADRCRRRSLQVWITRWSNGVKSAGCLLACFSKSVIGFLKSIDSLILAIATCFLVWIAFGQWDTLEKTDQTNREINRAFVKGQLLQITQNGIYWWIQPFIENTGNTQTKNMKVFVDDAFNLDEVNVPPSPTRRTPPFAPQDPEDAFLSKMRPSSTFTRIPLGAKASTPVGGFGFLSDYIDKMAKNRADGYVYGVIWYDDVFLRSEQHKSKFCFVVQPVKKGDNPTTISYGLCRYWNCTDDECDKQKEDYDSEVRAISRRLGTSP